jgi:hypothetical protein
MCIETLEPNLPQFTLIKLQKGERIIQSHNKRPILTTDQDALIQYATMRAKMNPTATYLVSRVTLQIEI